MEESKAKYYEDSSDESSESKENNWNENSPRKGSVFPDIRMSNLESNKNVINKPNQIEKTETLNPTNNYLNVNSPDNKGSSYVKSVTDGSQLQIFRKENTDKTISHGDTVLYYREGAQNTKSFQNEDQPPEREIRINSFPKIKFPPINRNKIEDWNNYDPESKGDVAYYNFDSNIPLMAYSLNK